MKIFFVLFVFLFFCFHFLSQGETQQLITYVNQYEQEILTNTQATNLELLMAMGENPSPEHTKVAKKQIDDFISELKSSHIMNFSEVKLIKELHHRVHKRFLSYYQSVIPFHRIFETGGYNCVSATALFALILEGLAIPYNIQEQPTHVYIMAYPDSKSISVEMTALKNVTYLPSRKDVSNSINALYALGLITEEDIQKKGLIQIYNSFYNTNDVINLRELAGIQYFNEAIIAVDNNLYQKALNSMYKTDKMYGAEKTKLLKAEILIDFLSNSKFDSMKDIIYLITYANINKASQKNVYNEYSSFVHEQLVRKNNKSLVDSSYIYTAKNLIDTTLLSELSSIYYLGLSEYFSSSYNLKKRLENAELAYNYSKSDIRIQLWLAGSILLTIADKFHGEELIQKMDTYGNKYPFLQSNNLYRGAYFSFYTELSNEFYIANDGKKGKMYFDKALESRNLLDDKEVLDPQEIGLLYSEAGAFLYRENDYVAALKLLEEGLEFAPNHERLLAKIKIVKSKIK